MSDNAVFLARSQWSGTTTCIAMTTVPQGNPHPTPYLCRRKQCCLYCSKRGRASPPQAWNKIAVAPGLRPPPRQYARASVLARTVGAAPGAALRPLIGVWQSPCDACCRVWRAVLCVSLCIDIRMCVLVTGHHTKASGSICVSVLLFICVAYCDANVPVCGVFLIWTSVSLLLLARVE